MIGSSADLADGDALAFEIFRRLDRRRSDEDVIHLVHHAGDYDQVGAPRPRADHRLSGHADHRQVARDQRLGAARAALDQDQIDVNAEPFIETFLLRHPDRRLVGAQ